MAPHRFIIYLLVLAGSVIGQTIETEVTIPQPKSGESRYFYVPFDVPKDTQSISVTYKYDTQNGANVLDLGLFDSRFDGTNTSLSGFRGWSGGRRQTVFVGRDAASNGYLPREMPPGKWRVIFGLYKIVPAGVKVSISVSLDSIPAAAENEMRSEAAKVFDFTRTPRTAPPKAGGFTWFRGDLHTHTFHSDGSWTLKGILDYASANNLDYVAVTEHNTKSHHLELDNLRERYPDLLVLTGEEVTTYGGHMNVWGLPNGSLIDFRVTPGDSERLAEIVRSVRDLKIPISINHPSATCGGCSWTYGDGWSGMDSVEIWNGSWDVQDEAALRKWDALLNTGARITAIGSSDSHTPPSETNSFGTNLAIGGPTNFIGSRKLVQRELLNGIFSGRVYVADRPDRALTLQSGKTIIGGEISARAGANVRFTASASNFPSDSKMLVISDGKEIKPVSAAGQRSAVYDLTFAKSSYVRLEMRDQSGKMLAFTNPIFIKITQ